MLNGKIELIRRIETLRLLRTRRHAQNSAKHGRGLAKQFGAGDGLET